MRHRHPRPCPACGYAYCDRGLHDVAGTDSPRPDPRLADPEHLASAREVWALVSEVAREHLRAAIPATVRVIEEEG